MCLGFENNASWSFTSSIICCAMHVNFFQNAGLRSFKYYKQSATGSQQPRGAAVHFPCNGTLCGQTERSLTSVLTKRVHKNGCYITEEKHSYPAIWSSALCSTSNELAWGALDLISFELRPFIHFWHLQLDGCTPLEGLLALSPHWGPTSHSGKTQCIWLALPGSTCVFCLARAAGGGERANYQPPLRDQYDVILLLRHNRLQMSRDWPLCSLIHLRKSGKA